MNYDGMITAEIALLIGTLDANAKKALVQFLQEMILARESKFGSVMMRFKGASIFVETNRKKLFKDT